MTTVTILELTGDRQRWTSTHQMDSVSDAVAAAIHAEFGPRAQFHPDAGLPPGYGAIVQSEGASSAGPWRARVLMPRVRIDTASSE